MKNNTAQIDTMLDRTRGERKHTISVLVANRPGALIRISLVFARRGYNIDSLVVSPSSNPEYSMMNIVASGDEKTLDQILKQLNKLIDVVHASDRTGEDIIQRELALIKIACTTPARSEILQLARALQCDIVDIGEAVITLEITGSSDEVDNVTRVLNSYEIIELVRTGKVLMVRGDQHTA
ncbi:acetolactate synthase small subunit [Alkalispirochaeta sphaeroplastigenens]|nr:acetolactate synthase small subunit [Alkalispirochaeta sphaeroplastigenens]